MFLGDLLQIMYQGQFWYVQAIAAKGMDSGDSQHWTKKSVKNLGAQHRRGD